MFINSERLAFLVRKLIELLVSINIVLFKDKRFIINPKRFTPTHLSGLQENHSWHSENCYWLCMGSKNIFTINKSSFRRLTKLNFSFLNTRFASTKKHADNLLEDDSNVFNQTLIKCRAASL